MAIQLVIVDSHPVVVDGLSALLAAEREIEVVGVAGSVADAKELLAAVAADVALLDIRLADGLVFNLLSEIATGGATQAILYSSFDNDQYVAEAIRRGARGFVLKTTRVGDLLQTIRRVAAGGYEISPRQIDRGRTAITLSARERDLVRLVVDGCSNSTIGNCLGLATNSVERFLSRLYERVNVTGRVELVVRSEREGWLESVELSTVESGIPHLR